VQCLEAQEEDTPAPQPSTPNANMEDSEQCRVEEEEAAVLAAEAAVVQRAQEKVQPRNL